MSKNDSIDLCCYLNKIFEDRIELSLKKGVKNYYYLVGKFDGFPINFEYDKRDGYLLINTSSTEDYFLYELIPSISLFMGDKSPVAKYSCVDGNKKVIGNTIEWCNEVENRIRTLRNNELSQEYEIANVKTFVETRDEREKRLGFTELIPVFFPDGKLNDVDRFTDMVNEYSEQDAYLSLNSLRSVLFQVQTKRRTDFTLDECNNALYIILSKISTFFVNQYDAPVMAFYSDEFAKWDRKWRDYFKYDVRCQYMEEKLKGNDTFYFYPGCAKILKFERSMKSWGKK